MKLSSQVAAHLVNFLQESLAGTNAPDNVRNCFVACKAAVLQLGKGGVLWAREVSDGLGAREYHAADVVWMFLFIGGSTLGFLPLNVRRSGTLLLIKVGALEWFIRKE